MDNKAFFTHSIPYITVTIGIITVFLLYFDHKRKEKLADIELELRRKQLEILKNSGNVPYPGI
jgi:hypothetical protein